MMVAVGVDGEVAVVAAAVGPSAGSRRADAAAEGGGGAAPRGSRAARDRDGRRRAGGARALAEYPRAARAGGGLVGLVDRRGRRRATFLAFLSTRLA